MVAKNIVPLNSRSHLISWIKTRPQSLGSLESSASGSKVDLLALFEKYQKNPHLQLYSICFWIFWSASLSSMHDLLSLVS